MSIGYISGEGRLRRAHPFTPVTLAALLVILALVLPAPVGPVALCLVAVALAVFEGVSGILKPALLVSLPFWVLSFLVDGLVRDLPLVALGLAARITTVVLALLILLAVVDPPRLLDALVEQRVPFSLAFTIAASLQALPRLRQRAREILDAQRCRGLSIRGSAAKRARAVVLGVLAQGDQRTIALESRAGVHVIHRTPLDPPADHPRERLARWGMLALLLAAIVLRIVL